MKLFKRQEKLVQDLAEHDKVLVMWQMGCGAIDAIKVGVPLTERTLVVAPKMLHQCYYRGVSARVVTPQYVQKYHQELTESMEYDYCLVSHMGAMEWNDSETLGKVISVAQAAPRACWYTNYHVIEPKLGPGWFKNMFTGDMIR